VAYRNQNKLLRGWVLNCKNNNNKKRKLRYGNHSEACRIVIPNTSVRLQTTKRIRLLPILQVRHDTHAHLSSSSGIKPPPYFLQTNERELVTGNEVLRKRIILCSHELKRASQRRKRLSLQLQAAVLKVQQHKTLCTTLTEKDNYAFQTQVYVYRLSKGLDFFQSCRYDMIRMLTCRRPQA
jgi:hypothetical protein